RSAFRRMYHFETYVTGDVEGLSKGSAVKARGVDVGKVTEIGFSWRLYENANPRCVVVRFGIDEHVSPWPAGVEFGTEFHKLVDSGFRGVVQSQGISGSSILALKTLDPKQDPPLEVSCTPRDDYVASPPSQAVTALASLERSLR